MILEFLPLVLVTALLSSLLTLVGAFMAVRWFLKNRLESLSDELADDFERKLTASFEQAVEALLPEFRAELESGFRESAEALLPEFREQMKDGFHQAGQELMPELRTEVREGFKDGLVQTLSGEIVPHTAQSVAKKGSSILGKSLSRILGKKKG